MNISLVVALVFKLSLINNYFPLWVKGSLFSHDQLHRCTGVGNPGGGGGPRGFDQILLGGAWVCQRI